MSHNSQSDTPASRSNTAASLSGGSYILRHRTPWTWTIIALSAVVLVGIIVSDGIAYIPTGLGILVALWCYAFVAFYMPHVAITPEKIVVVNPFSATFCKAGSVRRAYSKWGMIIETWASSNAGSKSDIDTGSLGNDGRSERSNEGVAGASEVHDVRVYAFPTEYSSIKKMHSEEKDPHIPPIEAEGKHTARLNSGEAREFINRYIATYYTPASATIGNLSPAATRFTPPQRTPNWLGIGLTALGLIALAINVAWLASVV